MKHSPRKNRGPKAEIVPSEDDWGKYRSDVDQEHAHSIFAGRTNEEMQPFFRRNPIEVSDDLPWMPDVPFRYYILGFRDFVMGKQFDRCNQASAADCFLGLVLEKLENHPRLIVPVMHELMVTVEYVARNQTLFDADVEIYGNFMDRLSRIQTLYAPYASLNR